MHLNLAMITAPFISEMVWVVGFCCFIFVYSLPLCLFGFQENPGFACSFMVVVNWFMKLWVSFSITFDRPTVKIH